MSSAETVVRVENLTKRVASPEGELVLLDHIQFQIQASEAVAITGASGSGKSTLLGLLAGLDVPSSGRVFIDGQDWFALTEDERAARRGEIMGFVFQTFQLLPNLTALENVMLPLELSGRRDARSAATDILERVGLGHRLHHTPGRLSGGEAQRVALARAFAPRPRLLLADEPTGSLDSATGDKIIELLFDLNREQQATLLLVTHDQALAARCGRRLELHAGRLDGES